MGSVAAAPVMGDIRILAAFRDPREDSDQVPHGVHRIRSSRKNKSRPYPPSRAVVRTFSMTPATSEVVRRDQ